MDFFFSKFQYFMYLLVDRFFGSFFFLVLVRFGFLGMTGSMIGLI